MKLTLALLSATAFAASAFTVPSSTNVPIAFTRTHGKSSSIIAVNGNKASIKGLARKKWAEARGFTDDGATTTESTDAKAGLLTNEEGLEYVKLVHPDTGASSEIYLLGGVVTSYMADGVEYVAVRPDAKMDGSKPISGGLSHCWPQFGPGAIQQHGFARNEKWTVKSMTDTTVELELAPSDSTKAMWDKEFLCTFSVSLDDAQLTTKMLVDNKGEESFEFQAALHSYFTVSSLENLEITGSFEGKEFLNKMVGDEGEMQTEKRAAITISEEYDRVYKGVNDPVLKDSGTGKALSVLNTAGWEDTVLWNPYGDEGMGFNNFVCVESVKFDPVTLAGGESWTGDMALKADSL